MMTRLTIYQLLVISTIAAVTFIPAIYAITFLDSGNKISFEWTWLHGETVGNQHTTEAEILLSGEEVPSAASQKHGYFYPGSRAGASLWQVTNGKFWMFGGHGFDDKPTNEPKLLNDLWEFDTAKQLWRLLDDVDPKNYREDSNNEGPIPLPRKHSASCGIENLVYVVFGGEGAEGDAINDTWLYYTQKSEWLFLSLASHLSQPQGRKDMAYWCDKERMVIFGGIGANNQSLNDMWEFSLKALLWNQIELDNKDNKLPTDRAGPLCWKSKSMLYMYGGYSMTPSNQAYGLEDLWQYSYENKTWEELHSGIKPACLNNTTKETTTRQESIVFYSKLGKIDHCNCPGRRRHSATWTDTDERLWLFGGEILPPKANRTAFVYHIENKKEQQNVTLSSALMSDLWLFDNNAKSWLWMGMSTQPNIGPIYGTNYSPGANNRPGARCQMVSWTRKGQMLLFGGLGVDARNKTVYLNDLWLVTHSQVRYDYKVNRDWFRRIPPGTVFFIVLGTFGGVVFSFGVGFYLKKMMESPNHNPSEFKVKYSRVHTEPFFD